MTRPTPLVKVLQEVDYPALNLVLAQAGRGGVETNSLEGESRSELSRASHRRAADLESSLGLDGTRHRGPQ